MFWSNLIFARFSHRYYNVLFYFFWTALMVESPFYFEIRFSFCHTQVLKKGWACAKAYLPGCLAIVIARIPMAQNLTYLNLLKFMIGQHRDHSKWLLPPYNTKLCGFWRKGSHYWGCGKRGTEYTGPPISRELSIFLAVTQVESTFYGFKRLLGRKAGDPRITAEMGGRYG